MVDEVDTPIFSGFFRVFGGAGRRYGREMAKMDQKGGSSEKWVFSCFSVFSVVSHSVG